VSVYSRLSALGVTLPQVTPSVALFVPFVRTGRLIFVSGHIARRNGEPWVGRLGEQITVANGASELLHQVFGDRGPHARTAIGVAQLPLGACVEIELIAEVA
jgi:enamine deaminase RidA (YjgF/YER057c/UK114 family)